MSLFDRKMPERCEVIHQPSGRRFPLVPRYEMYDAEQGFHVWTLLLHPDVDGEVTGRSGELAIAIGKLPGRTTAAMGFEVVDRAEGSIRVLRFDDFES